MSAPSTSSSRALSRGRAGRRAIRSCGSLKSKRSTRMKAALAAEVRLYDFRRLVRRFTGSDRVNRIHPADHTADHRVIVVELRMRGEHDEELAVRAILAARPRCADAAAKERHGGELGLEVGQVRPALARSLRVAALRHEAGDHAVEVEAVVEALAHK